MIGKLDHMRTGGVPSAKKMARLLLRLEQRKIIALYEVRNLELDSYHIAKVDMGPSIKYVCRLKIGDF